MSSIAEEDATRRLEAAESDDDDDDGNVIDLVLEEDVVQASISSAANDKLTLRQLAGRLCTFLILGSKRRPSCLTRTIRQDLVITDEELRATVVLPKESRKSASKARQLVCPRFSTHAHADVVSILQAYQARVGARAPTILVHCNDHTKAPRPDTIRHWVRAYLTLLGYDAKRLTPKSLIKSVTTAQLADGVPAADVAAGRWDSTQTMLRFYDARNREQRVHRPQSLVPSDLSPGSAAATASQ